MFGDMCPGLPGPADWAWRSLTLALVAGLLVSCTGTGSSSPEPDGTAVTSPAPSRATAAGSPTPTSRSDEAATKLPAAPARDVAALAREIERAMATLRKRSSTTNDVRRAAEFQQLALLALATGSAEFRRAVTTRLPPDTIRLIEGDVRAARLLYSMTEPQPDLPDWRIVAPPPATELLGYYQRAQRRTGVGWTYLAAINLVETRMGRIRGQSSAGARGPMQFLPSTWRLYGAGGDINDPRDAIFAAARLLRHHGAPGDMAEALWHYNPSDDYVRAVLEHARTMQRSTLAYRGYWHWRVLYRHTRATYVLPLGYPKTRPVPVPGSST